MKTKIKIKNIATSKQVAKMLNCTERNIALMVKAGKLSPILLENRWYLFDIEDVNDFISQKKVTKNK